MKKALLITLLFIPLLGISQTRKPVLSFFGVKFGSDAETVKTRLAAKGARFIADSSSADLLLFANVPFETYKNNYLAVRLVDGKAFEADLGFPNTQPEKVFETYNALVKEINEIYGDGAPNRKFTGNYHEGDGHELEAVKTGNAEYYTIWPDEANNNALELKIDSSLYVIYLVFQNADLLEVARKKGTASN